jgi:hypothetical protein
MNPRAATEAEITYWTERDRGDQRQVVIGGPEEAPDVIPCPALVSTVFVLDDDSSMAAHQEVHVAYQLDEIEVAHLANGGTLWLTTWGGLPVHLVEVVPRG